MGRLTIYIFSLFFVASSATADKQADALFESVFGRSLRDATQSRDRKDDIALAKRLVDAARLTKHNLPFVEKLCDQAYALSFKSSDGRPIATSALLLLIEQVPKRTKDAGAKVFSLLERAARTSTATERLAAIAKAVEVGTAIAETHAKANAFKEAGAIYRRLITLTKRALPNEAATLQDKLNDTITKQKLIVKKENLDSRLLRNATDAVAAKELVYLTVIDFEDIAEARRLAPRTGDAELIQYVELASKRQSNLNEADQMKLATWFYELVPHAESSMGERRLRDRALQTVNDILDGNPSTATKLRANLLYKQMASDWMKKPLSRSIDLTKVKPVLTKVGAHELRINDGEDVSASGIRVTNHFYAHAPSQLHFKLEGDRLFRATGFNRTAGPATDGVKFIVKVDGKTIYTSKVVTHADKTAKIEIKLPFGGKQLELVVDAVGNKNADWSYWLDPVLIR